MTPMRMVVLTLVGLKEALHCEGLGGGFEGQSILLASNRIAVLHSTLCWMLVQKTHIVVQHQA